MTQLLPGDFFLVQIGGPGGLIIRAAQALAGDPSRYTHTGIVLDEDWVIAAQPGGARIDSIHTILNARPLAVSRNLLSSAQREEIVAYAASLKGRPYSFLAYLSLALLRLGIRPPRLRRFIADSGHMICSQFVDHVYSECGVRLFDDGRPSGDVTPGDLAHVGVIEHIGSGPREQGERAHLTK